MIKPKMMNREYILWISILLMIVVLCVVGLIWVNLQNQNEMNEYLDVEIQELDKKVQATLNYYEVFSSYIFEEIINTEAVLLLMNEANLAENEVDKALIRQALYDLLEDDYNLIMNYDFRQLHFHLPNNESFLRMHSPEKFGDNLTDIRESVSLVNENEISISGFEEGRIYNGFRFVYPLNYNGNHIGSVEVSISPSSIIETFGILYPEMNTYFLIKRDLVYEKVFDDQLGNYDTSMFSEDYLSDINVRLFSIQSNHLFNLSEEVDFIKGLDDDYKNLMKDDESFNIIEKYADDYYLVNFIVVKNIIEEPVAYFCVITKNDRLKFLIVDRIRELVSVSIIGLLLIIAVSLLFRNQIRLRKESNRDYLTQLYNRNRFTELMSYEFKRFKRYEAPFSVMMIDIDYFKKVNDTYGHNKGDLVLKNLSLRIGGDIRANDILGRWGGEEFICMMPCTDKKNSIIVAEKIRKHIHEKSIADIPGITVSIGVAQVTKEDVTISDLIDRADQALYEAKNSGRNKVK